MGACKLHRFGKSFHANSFGIKLTLAVWERSWCRWHICLSSSFHCALVNLRDSNATVFKRTWHHWGPVDVGGCCHASIVLRFKYWTLVATKVVSGATHWCKLVLLWRSKRHLNRTNTWPREEELLRLLHDYLLWRHSRACHTTITFVSSSRQNDSFLCSHYLLYLFLLLLLLDQCFLQWVHLEYFIMSLFFTFDFNHSLATYIPINFGSFRWNRRLILACVRKDINALTIVQATYLSWRYHINCWQTQVMNPYRFPLWEC